MAEQAEEQDAHLADREQAEEPAQAPLGEGGDARVEHGEGRDQRDQRRPVAHLKGECGHRQPRERARDRDAADAEGEDGHRRRCAAGGVRNPLVEGHRAELDEHRADRQGHAERAGGSGVTHLQGDVDEHGAAAGAVEEREAVEEGRARGAAHHELFHRRLASPAVGLDHAHEQDQAE